jgi:hypothetical protein
MEGRENLPAFSDHLGGELAVRMLQFLEGRNLGEHPYDEEEKEDKYERSRKENPENADYFFLCDILHFLIFD